VPLHTLTTRWPLQNAVPSLSQLLVFSRSQRLDLRPVIVSEIVRGMSELLHRTLGPEIQINIDAHNDTDAVLSDSTQLELAILNLALNAKDAMPDGGILTISSCRSRLEQDPELQPTFRWRAAALLRSSAAWAFRRRAASGSLIALANSRARRACARNRSASVSLSVTARASSPTSISKSDLRTFGSAKTTAQLAPKGKAPPGGQRGFGSLAVKRGGRAPAKSTYK
jgi:hypothetical protein